MNKKLAEALAKVPSLPALTAAALYPNKPELHDWEYKSVPWCTEEAWMTLLAVMGADNFKVVAGSTRTTNGVTVFRAQFIISPVGMENLRKEHKRRNL